MRARYLFEFCDQSWVPSGARECLFEVMDACNTGLRSFNAEVADQVLAIAQDHSLDTIVELGAGRAPVTAYLAEDARADGLTLVPSDIVPNAAIYRRLSGKYPGQVKPVFASVDITQPHQSLDSAVLVMAGMMHHVPFALRPDILKTLSQTNSRMIIVEPLKRTLLSMLMASLAFFPAWFLPITFIRQPGRLRRFFWCWLFPVVPLMFAWDGVTSCLRQWTAPEWAEQFDALRGSAKDVEIQPGFNSLRIVWSGKEMKSRARARP